MKLIPLTKGYFAKVDDEDFERLSQFSWSVLLSKKTLNYYARRTDNVTRSTIMMHHEVFSGRIGKLDHIDGDGLNNQKSNLRPCTNSQNGMNARKRINTCGYKGVSMTTSGKFRARISINGKTQHCGSFSDPIEAAAIYDYHAHVHYGEFANTNKVLEVR